MAVTSQKGGDYYTANPSALEGQPKRAIADYAEQKGILVPKRFSSLKEARNSGVDVLARSEHRQEYDGSSGFLETVRIRDFPKAETREQLKEQLLIRDSVLYRMKEYCKLLGIDFDNFREGVSYSFWELLNGIGRKVVADSSVKGRYHITTGCSIYDSGELLGYTIFEYGKPIRNLISPIPEEFEKALPGLVENYETIRNFDRFDPNNCPIMEFVTFGGKDYFLQYHKGREFEASTFSLDRRPTKGEIDIFFVRGATQPEGISCNVTMDYAWSHGKGEQKLPEKEDASFDFFIDKVFSELMVRKRKLQIIEKAIMPEFAAGHAEYSKLMKPQVSIVEDVYKILTKAEIYTLDDIITVEGKDVGINVHVVSDGTHAYLMRI
jgi:hypothetical protein